MDGNTTFAQVRSKKNGNSRAITVRFMCYTKRSKFINHWKYEVQLSHGLDPKRNESLKPIIAIFMCYKKRNQFISSKKKVKDSVRFSNVFVAEDLISLRAKLLRYVKDKCNNQFEQIHTKSSSILMKTFAETDEL